MPTKIFTILLLVTALFSLLSKQPVQAATDTKSYPPNYSFENWSLRDGKQLPNNWVVVQANDLSKAIHRSQHNLNSLYGMELQGTFPQNSQEKTNPKATIVRTNLFYVSGFQDKNQESRAIVHVKSLTPQIEIRGKLGLIDWNGLTICEEKFTIPAGTTTWTRQVTNCPNSDAKMGIVITQNTHFPAVYDEASVVIKPLK